MRSIGLLDGSIAYRGAVAERVTNGLRCSGCQVRRMTGSAVMRTFPYLPGLHGPDGVPYGQPAPGTATVRVSTLADMSERDSSASASVAAVSR